MQKFVSVFRIITQLTLLLLIFALPFQGHNIVVYDVSDEAMKRLEDEGASIASCPSEVASKVDRVITMLPNSQHVRSCYMGDKGVFQLVNENYLYFKSAI